MFDQPTVLRCNKVRKFFVVAMSGASDTAANETKSARFRLYHEEVPVYGKESPYFTVHVCHGGIVLTKSNNLVYEHGEVDYMDNVDSMILNRQFLDKFVKGVGFDLPMGFLYKKQ
ncbi:Uncharacterized protein Adt_09657 [Abeliophyllum distichum]|uniref:Uncharacterized protein n=1 Tax=Abeliophyllum distichum TaxID=126358 RepID=A0ABD1UIP1_9LAMI